VDIFAFCSPILIFMFSGSENSKRVVVRCKGCGENIPAPVETMPSQPVAAHCPLCHEHRRYVPSEVFLGRLSHLMIRKPASTADGRAGR
jgi:RNase P subunit RPR2